MRARHEWIGYTPGGGGAAPAVPRPMLPVVLQNGSMRIQAVGLVDSGSDNSVLPPDLASRLDLQPRVPSGEVETLGGDVPVGKVRADLRVALISGPLVLPSAPFLVPLVGNRPRLVILGRVPLFEEAQVTFQDWRERFAVARRRLPRGSTVAIAHG